MAKEKKDLNIYVNDIRKIIDDYKKLKLDDLIEIFNLHERKNPNLVVRRNVSPFLLELIRIKTQEKILKTNKWLVIATCVLVVATIIFALVKN